MLSHLVCGTWLWQLSVLMQEMITPTSRAPRPACCPAHPEPPALRAEKEGRVSVWGPLRATPRSCILVGWAFRGHRKRCSQPLW